MLWFSLKLSHVAHTTGDLIDQTRLGFQRIKFNRFDQHEGTFFAQLSAPSQHSHCSSNPTTTLFHETPWAIHLAALHHMESMYRGQYSAEESNVRFDSMQLGSMPYASVVCKRYQISLYIYIYTYMCMIIYLSNPNDL